METVTTGAAPPPGAPPRPWWSWPALRWAWIGLLVVGVVLLGLGVAGFVSAAGTNDDAEATEAQVADLAAETAQLQVERDQAVDAAALAAAEDRTLTDAAIDVQSTADDLEQIYRRVSDASNAMVACSDLVDEVAFLSCTRDALGGFQAATAELDAATTDLQAAIAALEEGLG